MSERQYLYFSGDKKRTFSTKELAEIAGISEVSVRDLENKLGLTKIVVKPNCFEWDYSSYIKIKAFAENRKKAKAAKNEAKDSVTNLEELKRLHPLVTDSNYFRTSYFPKSTPSIFQSWDIEEEF